MKENNLDHFKALTDIFIRSLRNRDHTHLKTFRNFFYTAFSEYRQTNHDQPVEYPDIFYELIYKTIEEMMLAERVNQVIASRTGGSIWLLGEIDNHIPSTKTYAWIWRNILLLLEYNQQDI